MFTHDTAANSQMREALIFCTECQLNVFFRVQFNEGTASSTTLYVGEMNIADFTTCRHNHNNQ